MYLSQWQHDSMHVEMLSLRAEVVLAASYPIYLHCLWKDNSICLSAACLPNECSLILLLPALGNKLTGLLQTTFVLFSGTTENAFSF